MAGAFCIGRRFAVSRALGEDARAFLNGQLSSDVKSLAAGSWQLSSYSTPKGRALATFLVAAQGTPETFWLVTRQSVAEPTFKRLAMFVLRSKVQWAHQTHVLIGVYGSTGGLALAELLGVEPPAAGFCAVPADASPWAQTCRAAGDLADPALLVVGLQADAWWLLLPESAVTAAADALRRLLPEIDGAGWDAVEVAAGRPWVEAGTVESFVPQMLNLDLTGGVSFKKGCYPGQEIVARTQYLGKVKRRMVRLACQSADGALPAPGTPVHAAGDDAQAIGEVVLAAPLAAGQVQLLAVLQMDLAAGADLRLGAPSGAALEPLELPYALGSAS